MSKYVMHDGKRWSVGVDCDIDGDPGYVLQRIIPGRPEPRMVFARITDCQPDTHEPRRVFKDATGSLTFYPKRGVILARLKGSRKPYHTSLSGILTMCARAEASRRALDRAHQKRLRQKVRKP